MKEELKGPKVKVHTFPDDASSSLVDVMKVRMDEGQGQREEQFGE